jgi:ketosteroid isomerase-like protein
MSQENVEVVRRCCEAFADDEETWLQALDPDLVWYPIEDAHVPARGIDGAKGVRQRWLDAWEEHSAALAVEDLSGAGENVVCTLHVSGRGRGSGVEVNLQVYPHYKVRDGRIVYAFEYPDRASALEAAGVRE